MERQRADDADRKALEAAHRYRHADNARIAAELNSTRANEVGDSFILDLILLLNALTSFDFFPSNSSRCLT